MMREVEVVGRSAEPLAPLVEPSHLARFESARRAVADHLAGRTLWHANSTSRGGGVAELLHALLGYLVDGGISTRWLVGNGTDEFFGLTKRLHNHLHGSPGDGGSLGERERRAYDEAFAEDRAELLELAAPGDVVVLHDPQTAGLIRPLRAAGIDVVWVCHIGIDDPNDLARSAWEFLMPDVTAASATVFSRPAYVWDGLEGSTTRVIPPCIDPTSPKNAELSAAECSAILAGAGVSAAGGYVPADAHTRVVHRADMVEVAPPPSDEPLVLQVSRWDRLKDPVGVLQAFARVPLDLDAHLLLAGPATVPDDPEGRTVLDEVVEARESLPNGVRDRVHLANLPVEDLVENAFIVNALQRRADVVVQKSLAEGFGLTVAEAMWKRRPVVGSRVGGIQDQIDHGESGLLVDPRDLDAFGDAITSLVHDPGFANAIGHGARERIRLRFLPPHFLAAHLELIDELLAAEPRGLSASSEAT
jgi:trehalose synthase